jgi:hypothetical protein
MNHDDSVWVFSIFMGMFSAMIGLAFAIMALILVAARYATHLLLLRWAGAFLCVVVMAHLFPMALVKAQAQVVWFAGLGVIAAACFGVLYYLAEIGDPSRSEGLLFANGPFWLAGFLCIFPLLRAWLRWLLIRDARENDERDGLTKR